MTEAAAGRSVADVFDAAAADYEMTGTDFFRPMGRRLVEVASLEKGWRILDVGTGRGAVLSPAAEVVGPVGRVVGVDVSPEMARRTAGDLAGGAAVVVADADCPPLAGPFDAVLGGMVVQFLPDPGRALRSWAALTRPSGVIALSWWAGDDPRFHAVDAAVARHVPDRVSRPGRAFSGDVEASERLLRVSGWAHPRTLVEEQDVRFTGLDAWWRWSWSHGQRRAWETVADFPALRRDVDAALVPLLDGDGSLRYRPQAAFTGATRALA